MRAFFFGLALVLFSVGQVWADEPATSPIAEPTTEVTVPAPAPIVTTPNTVKVEGNVTVHLHRNAKGTTVVPKIQVVLPDTVGHDGPVQLEGTVDVWVVETPDSPPVKSVQAPVVPRSPAFRVAAKRQVFRHRRQPRHAHRRHRIRRHHRSAHRLHSMARVSNTTVRTSNAKNRVQPVTEAVSPNQPSEVATPSKPMVENTALEFTAAKPKPVVTPPMTPERGTPVVAEKPRFVDAADPPLPPREESHRLESVLAGLLTCVLIMTLSIFFLDNIIGRLRHRAREAPKGLGARVLPWLEYIQDHKVVQFLGG